MASSVGTATSRTGTTLTTRRWAAVGEPVCGFLIVHGAAEHSGRYEHVGEALAAAGFDVHAYDHRGHGASGGSKMHVDSWSEYLDDVEDRLDALRPKGIPLVLYGHSMGGLICFDYVTSGRPKPDLLVLSAPMFEVEAKAWQRALAPIAGRLVPKLGLPMQLRGEQLSRDPSVGEAYFGDPLVHTKASARWGAEALRAQERVRDKRLSIPTLVVHGGADTIVPPGSTLHLEQQESVERRLYGRLRHELHNEPEGPEVVSDIIAWVQESLGRV